MSLPISLYVMITDSALRPEDTPFEFVISVTEVRGAVGTGFYLYMSRLISSICRLRECLH